MTAVLWGLAVLVTFGFGAPLLFGYAARRTHRRSWWVAAVVYGLLCWGGLVLAGVSADDSAPRTISGFMILAAWFGGAGHAFAARRELDRLVVSPTRRAVEEARATVEERREAQRLAAEEPAVALEMGIGRPELEGARHMGVVDVNAAASGALVTLPGVTDKLAREIIDAREAIDGFSSLADLGMALHLDGDTVEDLRPYVVFLPR